MGARRVPSQSPRSRAVRAVAAAAAAAEELRDRVKPGQAPFVFAHAVPTAMPAEEDHSEAALGATPCAVRAEPRLSKVQPYSECDAKNEKKVRFELTFKEVEFERVNHAVFICELINSFRMLGTSEAALSKFTVKLRKGSTIAQISGPESATQELKVLPLSDVMVMGSRATMTSWFKFVESPTPNDEAGAAYEDLGMILP